MGKLKLRSGLALILVSLAALAAPIAAAQEEGSDEAPGCNPDPNYDFDYETLTVTVTIPNPFCEGGLGWDERKIPLGTCTEGLEVDCLLSQDNQEPPGRDGPDDSAETNAPADPPSEGP